MDFGKRFKMLRESKGYTQTQIGRSVGVSTVTIRSWEKNESRPSMDALIVLSQLFGVSIDYLAGLENLFNIDEFISLNHEERGLLKKYRRLDDYGRKAVDVICDIEIERIEATETQRAGRYIPLFISPSAAGCAAPIGIEESEMIWTTDELAETADFSVRIQGDSMLPYLHDGEIAYVRKETRLSNGDIGIFCVDGSLYCKHYYLDNEQNLILVSANPDLRDSNIYVSRDSASTVSCFGRVLTNVVTKLPNYIFE